MTELQKSFISDYFNKKSKQVMTREQFEYLLKVRIEDLNHIEFVGDGVDEDIIIYCYSIATDQQNNLAILAKQRTQNHLSKAYGRDFKEKIRNRLKNDIFELRG